MKDYKRKHTRTPTFPSSKTTTDRPLQTNQYLPSNSNFNKNSNFTIPHKHRQTIYSRSRFGQLRHVGTWDVFQRLRHDP